MNKAEILELAERVEGLDGNDPTVDELTLLASGWELERADGLGERATWIDPEGRRTSRRQGDGWFRPTSSLDAAMALVPEGWAVESISIWPQSPDHADNKRPPQANARLLGTSIQRMGKRMIWGHSSRDGRAEGNSKFAPNAITAAALRAIAATMEDDHG